MAQSKTMLGVRIPPQLHQRIKVRVAQLGRDWTVARFVAEAIQAKLQAQKP